MASIEDFKGRVSRVGLTQVGEYVVSTVALYNGMYETMVWGPDDHTTSDQERYDTREEAADGHANMVRTIELRISEEDTNEV
jgi:hypothetical protein